MTEWLTERNCRALLVALEVVLFLADEETTQARQVYQDAEDSRGRLAVRLAELARKLGADWGEFA